MAREHLPIQIGLPRESAWEMEEYPSSRYVAFVCGDELPDPADAFDALGESFGVAPQDIAPLPTDADEVQWAFRCRIPSRTSPILVWCERVGAADIPDGEIADARWSILVEALLALTDPLLDAARLGAIVARVGGTRTRLMLNPDLGVVYRIDEMKRLFLAKRAGEFLDERHLFRVEIGARDRANGPFWLTTVGLHRVARPEIEMLEIPADELHAALAMVDAIAARFVSTPLPAAGVPFEAGAGLSVALVPVDEVIETISPEMPGGPSDRARLPRAPRAAICAAGKRGAFRPVWVPPHEVLQKLTRGESGLLRSERETEVQERLARLEWPAFLDALSTRAQHPARQFYAKVAETRAETHAETRADEIVDKVVEHVWLEVVEANRDSLRGRKLGADGLRAGAVDAATASAANSLVTAPIARLSDWVVTGVITPKAASPIEVGPQTASLLTACTHA